MNDFKSIYKKSISLVFILFCFNANTQQYNIVPNPSFENYIKCPSVYENSQVHNWYMPTNSTPNYINICDLNNCSGVPYNCGGNGNNYQYPRTGNAYMLCVYFLKLPPQYPLVRGYHQVKLTQPLQSGHCYYAGYYINLCNGQDMACNNAGLLFTNNAAYVDTVATPFGVLNATPQILSYGNPIIKDTLNWVKISGVYVANGGEEYITLGNFFNDANTIIDSFNTKPIKRIAYSIDDVFVIPLDSMPLKADAGKDTSIANVGDSVFIGSLTNGLTGVKWYDASNVEITSKAGVPGFYAKPTASTFYIIEQTVCGYYSRDTVNVTVGTVPLKFISYNLVSSLRGTKQSIDNIWTTANEINVSHFNILKSIDGVNFIIIGKIKAQNKITNEYSFTDETPNEGLNYYKIESVDFDGRKQYSTTQQINTKPQTPNIAVFPNPAKDYLNISSQENIKEIKIINQIGQVLEYQTPNCKQITINTKQLIKGVYIVQCINTKGEINTQKLIVTN